MPSNYVIRLFKKIFYEIIISDINKNDTTVKLAK